MIRLQNVKFTYPSKSQGKKFSLSVEEFSPGLCTAVMGDNGSGKTTLGKLAAGLLRPDSGFVSYNGQNIAKWKLGEIGQKVGYLFQEPLRQIFAPRVLEEITFPLTLGGMSKDAAEEKAWELIREFELENIANNTTYTLSRGEKQRLAIAAAMICNPQFFVLDEPTTGLDKHRRSILAKALHRLMADNIGVLLISHDKAFVKELGAEVILMDGGMLVEK